MSSRRPQNKETSLIAAFQDVTDGVMTLMVQHLQLFSMEVKNDGAIAARYIGALVFLVSIAVLGYAFLNIAAVLFAGWAFGIGGSAITMLVLAAGNLGISLRSMRFAAMRLSSDDLGPRFFSEEIKRSQSWAKQIQRENTDS